MMEKFIEVMKNNPKKAIVIAITILILAIGNFIISGCALKAEEILIKNLEHSVKTRGN